MSKKYGELYNGVLLSNNREQTTNTSDYKDEYQILYVRERNETQRATQCIIPLIKYSGKGKTGMTELESMATKRQIKG